MSPESKARVLVLVDHAVPEELVEECPRFPARVLVPTASSDLARRLRARGIEIDVLPLPRSLRPLRLAEYYRKLFRYYRMYGFEIVHSTGWLSHCLAIGLKVRFNSPLVWSVRSVPPAGWWLTAARLCAIVFCDKLVVSNPDVARGLGRLPAWKGRLRVLGHPESRASELREVYVEALGGDAKSSAGDDTRRAA